MASSIVIEYDTSGIGIGGKSSNTIVTEFIKAAFKPAQAVSYTHKEILRSAITRFSTLSYFNAENQNIPIKCIHANPERSVARMIEEQNFILPFITIGQNSSSNADDRRRIEPILITEKV